MNFKGIRENMSKC